MGTSLFIKTKRNYSLVQIHNKPILDKFTFVSFEISTVSFVHAVSSLTFIHVRIIYCCIYLIPTDEIILENRIIRYYWIHQLEKRMTLYAILFSTSRYYFVNHLLSLLKKNLIFRKFLMITINQKRDNKIKTIWHVKGGIP